MCVRNHDSHYKCCCCCDLRCAKITFTVLQSLAAIGAIVYGQWLSFGFALAFVVVAIITLVKHHSHGTQKFGFWFALIWAIATLCIFLAVLIMGFMGIDIVCDTLLDPTSSTSLDDV